MDSLVDVNALGATVVTATVLQPENRKVVGLNLSGCWAFLRFSLTFLYKVE